MTISGQSVDALTIVTLFFKMLMLGIWPTGTMTYALIFILSRCIHTAAYLRPTQPVRFLAYLTGNAVSIVLCCHLVQAVLS